MKKIWKLAISILIPFLAGAIGSLFTQSSVSSWYAGLVKPPFNPPDWIFGPVWAVLYLMMGISLYLVWIKKKDKKAFILFGTQMFLNALWSFLFFGLQRPLYSFFEIIILWASIIVTMVYFYRINKTSAYLLLPYVLWVSFAAVLNFFLYILN